MATKFVFDTEQWGALIGRCREAIATDHGQDVPGRLELAELLEIHPNTVDAWETVGYTDERFMHPSMSNMLKVCNIAGFDPSRLFKKVSTK